MAKPKRNQSVSTSSARDRCQTPPYAVLPLLQYLPKDRVIWEPAAGEGYLVKALTDGGLSVAATDVLTGTDYFNTSPTSIPGLENKPYTQITNPPYSLKVEWIERAYELGSPFAQLVPTETLSLTAFLHKRYGLQVLWLDKRVNFKMPNKGWKSSAQFPVVWLCFNLLPERNCYGHIPYNKIDVDPLEKPLFDFTPVQPSLEGL